MPGTDTAAARPTVLLVEDDLMVRATVRELLGGLDYDVLTASGPSEALACLQAEPGIGVLFSDVLMNAEMDGIALAVAARRLRPSIRVLLSSGVPLSAEQTSLVEGAEFLAKPYRLADLMASLERLG